MHRYKRLRQLEIPERSGSCRDRFVGLGDAPGFDAPQFAPLVSRLRLEVGDVAHWSLAFDAPCFEEPVNRAV
jgi:hypothetical protein